MSDKLKYLIGIETPKLQLFLEKRSAHVGRVVQFAGAVVIKDLRKDARVPIEEIFIEYGIIVGQSLRQPRQSRRRNLFQRRAVRLETEAANVEDDAILAVHAGQANRD